MCSGASKKERRSNRKTKALVKPRSIFKPKPCERLEMGQIVLCKMRGFCEWPGIVTGFQKNLVTIEFFGDHTSHKAAMNNFFNFEDSYDVILNNLRTKKTPSYAKSIQEAEYALGIPMEKSILNRIPLSN